VARRTDLDPGLGPDELDADLLDASAAAPEAAEPPLTDQLDLHTFRPRDCADVVAEYLRAALDAGLPRVRIVHGKGTGALRRIVHGVLDRHPAVRGYRLAGETSGGWGATEVELHPAGRRYTGTP